MRRFILTAALVALALSVFAGGKPETGVVTLTILGTRDAVQDRAVERFVQAVAPQAVNVRWLTLQIEGGTTLSMDTLVASGMYPSVYIDFTGRASRYMVKTKGWSAFDLSPYVNKNDYYDLGPWIRNGQLLGVPLQVPLQGMGINLDILKEAGYVLPAKDAWTIDAFLAMCKAVAKLPGKYGTALFAKNQSADYLWMNWFGSFGAKVFTGGDYSRATLNSPAGLATVRFLGSLVQAGYAPKDSADLWDDAALEMWQKGLVAAMPIRPDWIPSYMKTAVEQGMLKEPFKYVMYPFPKGPGVAAVPTVGAGSTAIANESSNLVIDALAGRLAATLAGKGVQSEIMALPSGAGSWPTVKGVPTIPSVTGSDLESWKTVDAILKSAGVMDCGYTLPKYAELRTLLFPRLAAVYIGKETAEQALTGFEKAANEILK